MRLSRYSRIEPTISSIANQSSIGVLSQGWGQQELQNKRQEHVDGEQEQKDKEVEEMMIMLRKQHGKKNQRRNFQDESSAPKRRRTENELRNASGDGEGEKSDMSGKRKDATTHDTHEEEKEDTENNGKIPDK